MDLMFIRSPKWGSDFFSVLPVQREDILACSTVVDSYTWTNLVNRFHRSCPDLDLDVVCIDYFMHCVEFWDSQSRVALTLDLKNFFHSKCDLYWTVSMFFNRKMREFILKERTLPQIFG